MVNDGYYNPAVIFEGGSKECFFHPGWLYADGACPQCKKKADEELAREHARLESPWAYI